MNSKILLAGCVVALASMSRPFSVLSAQSSGMPLRDAADSAQLARTTFRSAIERLPGGDTLQALKELEAAARAWPMQPAYADALLAIAGLSGDTARIHVALEMAASIHVALRNSASAQLRRYAQTARLRALFAQQDSLRASHANSRAFHTLPDSGHFPEGISADPRSGALYVSSLVRRNIVVVGRDGSASFLLAPNTPGVGSIFGLAVDTTRNVIWAASVATPLMMPSLAGDKVGAWLLAASLDHGKIVRRIPLPPNVANASPGDLAVTPTGDVLVSDAQAGVLWWLKRDADTLVAIRHHLFHSLQGIVASPDGQVAWVADYSVGLLRVVLADGAVSRVADASGETAVGLDGLVGYGQTIIGIQNGFSPARVVQLTLDATGTRVQQQRVLDQNPLANSPTNGTMIGDSFVFVANSLWDGVNAAGALPANAPHAKPLLLKLRLP